MEQTKPTAIYAVEAVTGRKFIHSPAVVIGIVVMTAVQDNDRSALGTLVTAS